MGRREASDLKFFGGIYIGFTYTNEGWLQARKTRETNKGSCESRKDFICTVKWERKKLKMKNFNFI